ncbi:MAG: ubiquinol-cytochrome c reductase iron-sulfur subunit [Actinomycetota bacterium]|nr:ubiquinol-cytochrome c reductase iron-sulfur subunit [Actinomycetota bacterium]
MNAQRAATIAFAVSIAASLGLVGVYWAGGDAQAEGVLLGLALGGLGVGVVVWATQLMDSPVETEEREELASPPSVVEDPGGAGDDVTRRSFLVRMLSAAGGTLVAALAIPSLSLGPRPGQSLFRTAWTKGARVVDSEGRALKPLDLVPDSVTTVYPEGQVGSEDAQTLVLRVDEDLLQLAGERASWAPGGCVGYSKICTHAGCPVGLYRAQAHELLCPCHQSTFDVLRGAVPTFGPADRPLPQLPMGLDDEGYLVALGDFPEPVGPGFWNLDSTDRLDDPPGTSGEET